MTVSMELWPSAPDVHEPIVSELTDSVDDIGRLLSSTAVVHTWPTPASNRFPLVVDELDVVNKIHVDEDFSIVGEEPGVVFYGSRASTSSQEDFADDEPGTGNENENDNENEVDEDGSSGVDVESPTGTPSSLSAEEFSWPKNNQMTVLRAKNPTTIAARRTSTARWSTITTSVPADAANCNCTALAWRSLRRKTNKALQAPPEDSYRKSSRSSKANLPESSDSGADTLSTTSSTGSPRNCGAEAIPPKSPKRRSVSSVMSRSVDGNGNNGGGKKRGASTIGVFINSVVYKMFRLQKAKSTIIATSTKAGSPGPGPVAVVVPQQAAPAPAEAPKTENSQTFQNGSPRWRDDPTNEALPLSASATSNALSASPNVAPMLTSKSPKPLVFSPLQSPSKPAQTLALSTSIVASVAKLDLHEPPPVAVAVAPKQAVAAVSAHVSASVPPTPTLQRPPRTPQQSRIAGKLAHVAPFHFPTGRPIDDQTNAATLSAAKAIFAGLPGNMAKEEDFERIVRVLRLPFYTKKAVYEACCRAGGLDKTNLPSVPVSAFEAYFSTMARTHHDEAARFVYTLSAAAEGTPLKRDYLIPSDFEAILYDLIETYPGLKFLNETPQFHTRYIEVVIARIFWSIGGPWRNRITPALLRRATLLAAMRELETTDDINKVTDFFCYEHFYVIYCKFWEIDTNHEMVITKDQMRGYGKGSITDSIIERIFSRAVNRLPKHLAGPGGPEGRSPAGGFASSSTPSDSLETIGFEEFVRFILAEEDKKHPSSIEYWFRIMDLDGDGVISMLEMEHFYQDVSARCLQINCDALAFEDVVCMMYDLVSPQRGTSTPKITLSALKKCGLAHRFFNTFVNFFKFLEQETSEGERTSVKTNGDRELTDWEQFCACEYEVLMAQEAGGDDGSDAYDLIVDDDGDGDVLNGDNLIFS